MAIKPPAWAKGAHPTISGWMKGRELLVAKTISQSDIDEWNGTLGQAVRATPALNPTPKTTISVDDFNNKNQKHEEEVFPEIENMSKRELEEFARTKGVELDRRHSKRSLLTIVKDIMK